MRKMINLCLAHMSEEGWEMKYVQEAFDTNWVVPLGPNVNAFEEELERFVARKEASPKMWCEAHSSGEMNLASSQAQPHSVAAPPKGKDLGVHTADPMWYDRLKGFAEENRKNPTDAERVLWNTLKANGIGYKFRQQHIIEDFIVDFFCCEKKLTIELDGGYHNMPEQMKTDEERTARLNQLGYTELRFTNEQVIGDFDNTLAEIERLCKSLPSGGDLEEAPQRDCKSLPLGGDLEEASASASSPRVVALSSGTAAVHLALLACGVGPGDEVCVQSFTFCASSHPVTYLGAKPVFIGSEAETWNMDPVLLEEAILDRKAKTGHYPKAIIPVSLYGMPYRADLIMEVANRYGIPVVEDSAEGFGSFFNGKALGTFGRFGVLSFNGNKMITTSGGGALICNGKASPKMWCEAHSSGEMNLASSQAQPHSVAAPPKGKDFPLDCERDCKSLPSGGDLEEASSLEEASQRLCKSLPSGGDLEEASDLASDLASPSSEWNTIMWYATQARDSYPYYEHTAIGYNYRLSNVCAGIGRGQMKVAEAHIAHHRHIAQLYKEAFADIKGITFHEGPDWAAEGSNYWLNTITLDPDLKVKGQENAYKEVIKTAVGGAAGVIHMVDCPTTDCQPNENVEAMRVFMLEKKIEARPLWKPMHCQPVYAVGSLSSNSSPKGKEGLDGSLSSNSSPKGKEGLGCTVIEGPKMAAYTNDVEVDLFKVGMCLPSGPCVTDEDVKYIVECIKEAIEV